VIRLSENVTTTDLDVLEPGFILDFTNSLGLSQSLRQGSTVTARWINGNSYFVNGEKRLFAPGLTEIQALGMMKPCLF